jgi:hypothetical protein
MSIVKKLVENPHPIYKRYAHYWNFLIASYEGGIDYTECFVPKMTDRSSQYISDITIMVGGKPLTQNVGANLFQHPKERNKDYQDRIQMSFYYNFCAPVVDIYTEHLFKQPIDFDRGSIEQSFLLRENNIDRRMSSINEFRKEVCDLAQIYGQVGVVVDMPPARGEMSRADEIRNDKFPFFTIYAPQNIINWSQDVSGDLNWIVLREFIDGNTDYNNYDEKNIYQPQYRIWTRTGWQLYDAGYNLVGSGDHNIGRVPFVMFFGRRSKKYYNSLLGVSDICDIAFIARDIFNSCSELKQILRDQTFAFLAIEGTADEYDDLSIGTSKGLIYPKGNKTPSYVSPPQANAEIYFQHIDRQISKIFQIAKLEGGSAKFEGQNAVEQSGVSKAWDFNQTNTALSRKADNMQDGESKLWDLFSRWEGKEFDGSISYPNDFNVKSLLDDLTEAEKLLKIEVGSEFNKEVKKAIIRKKFDRMPDDVIKKMIDDVDENEGKDKEVLSFRQRMPNLFNREIKS